MINENETFSTEANKIKPLFVIGGFLGLIVIIAILWLAFSYTENGEEKNQKTAETFEVAVNALENSETPSVKAPTSENPIKQVLPKENPVEKTNPFKNVYQNPFE